MKTQEQQEEEYGFYIISTMEVTKEYDKKTRTEKLKKQPVVTHLSYKIVVPGKETILRGFYPKKDEDTKNSINTLKSLFVKSEGGYVDDTKRLELANEWDALYPNDKASYTKKAPFTNEEVLKAYTAAEERIKNPGTYDLQSSNCVHEVQEGYQGSGRQGRFTDIYTSEELDKQPGLTMSGLGRAFMAGSFFPGDKPLTVLGASAQEVAEKYNVDESRISQREAIQGIPDYDTAIAQEYANRSTFVIAPNPELVASAASEEAQIDEHLAQLAVTEDEGLNAQGLIKNIELFKKAKAIINSALKLFKEKFYALCEKFHLKLEDDIEKLDKEASSLEHDSKAEYKAICVQKQQEAESIKKQIQSSFEAQCAFMKQQKNSENTIFYQQKVSEHQAACIAKGEQMIGVKVIDCSDISAQTNVEIQAFLGKVQSELLAEESRLKQQAGNQIDTMIAAKGKEARVKCDEHKASIEQSIKSISFNKKTLKENAENKEKAKIEDFNKKVENITENTSLLERLKEAVGNSGDAEAVINEELNVFLQGVANDFGVDALNL